MNNFPSFNCSKHPEEILIAMDKDPSKQDLYCLHCLESVKLSQTLSIQSLVSQIGKTEKGKISEDIQKQYEDISSILFSKDEFLHKLSNHIETEKEKLNQFIDKVFENIKITLNDWRSKQIQRIQDELKSIETNFQNYDEQLTKLFDFHWKNSEKQNRDTKTSFSDINSYKKYLQEIKSQVKSSSDLKEDLEKNLKISRNSHTHLLEELKKRPVFGIEYFESNEMDKITKVIQNLSLRINDQIGSPIPTKNFRFNSSASNPFYEFFEGGKKILSKNYSHKCIECIPKIPSSEVATITCQVKFQDTFILGIVKASNVKGDSWHENEIRFWSQDGRIYQNGPISSSSTPVPSQLGTICLKLNPSAKQISISVNGNNGPIASYDPTIEYCFYMSFKCLNDEAVIIDN